MAVSLAPAGPWGPVMLLQGELESPRVMVSKRWLLPRWLAINGGIPAIWSAKMCGTCCYPHVFYKVKTGRKKRRETEIPCIQNCTGALGHRRFMGDRGVHGCFGTLRYLIFSISGMVMPYLVWLTTHELERLDHHGATAGQVTMLGMHPPSGKSVHS